VRCRQESARIDLRAGQTEGGNGLQRLAQRLVVQDGFVYNEFHAPHQLPYPPQTDNLQIRRRNLRPR
jgi:hypothetical protein